MKSKNKVVAFLEYAAFRLVAWLLQLFPTDLNLRTARLLGWLWWQLVPRHRERARTHLRMAFGDHLSDEAVDRIGLAAHQQQAMLAVEFLGALRRVNEWSWHRYVEPGNLTETFKHLVEGHGAICVTGHCGNWELTGHLLATVGFNVVAVMRPLDNPYINDFVVRTRAQCGLKLLNKIGASAEAEEALRRGAAVCFVADQNAGRKGVFVDFFGHQASTYKSIALLAIRCDVPVIVGFARRDGSGFRYQVGVERFIRPEEWRDRADPVEWITQAYTAAIEAIVREAPEQYLWIHRRWKTQPDQARRRRSTARAAV